jgi:hypothetical protein
VTWDGAHRYQAAVYDLLSDRLDGDVITNKYTDGKGQAREKQVVLGAHDEIWDTLRYEHVDAVGAKVTAALKTFQVRILE